MEKLGESLAKHSESVLFASRNSSKEHEKDHEDKERDREFIIRNKLNERIDSLRDSKRALETQCWNHSSLTMRPHLQDLNTRFRELMRRLT